LDRTETFQKRIAEMGAEIHAATYAGRIPHLVGGPPKGACPFIWRPCCKSIDLPNGRLSDYYIAVVTPYAWAAETKTPPAEVRPFIKRTSTQKLEGTRRLVRRGLVATPG